MHTDKQLFLERASTKDSDEIARLYVASRTEALPYLPRVHTDDEVCTWIRDVALTRGEAWRARLRSAIVGFMVLVGDELEQLYVLPGHYRCGVGRKLLDLAKARGPARLSLYSLQRNVRARTFYESPGFRIIDMTDGLRNEEKEPDICCGWNPTPQARPKMLPNER